ncbi:hypothetical protein [Hyphococcus lacteus]|uniref:DUF1254 domain-containing protein n=1 Tax=Hyphococcus lacteus TaxID=3143536 RepID=A0ABV3Z7G5_9PROT
MGSTTHILTKHDQQKSRHQLGRAKTAPRGELIMAARRQVKLTILTAGALTACIAVSPAANAQDLSEAISEAAGIPQVDAFLPDKYSVEKTDPLPIDGVWMISTIRKKIRIEGGRAYAIDSWLHLFTLKVQPDMVVVKDLQRSGPGVYTGFDLPLMGESTLTLNDDGNLNVSVAGMLGPAKFALIRREVGDETAFQAERDIKAGRVTQPALTPVTDNRPPSIDNPPTDGDPLADCVNLDINPSSGEVFCAD